MNLLTPAFPLRNPKRSKQLSIIRLFLCLVNDVLRHFQQYFSYIVAVNCIGGGNQRTRRKPPTDLPHVTDKLYHIMLYTSP